MTESGLKIEDQNSMVRENVYDVKGKIESVKRRINASEQTSERNRQLIYSFCDYRRLQGLSSLRILFYLNRFWNIARYTTKRFDRMDKREIEALVQRVQNSSFSPRTVADHLTVIKTFWKWLEGKDEIYPEKVAWIKPRYNNRKVRLPEELLTKDDIDRQSMPPPTSGTKRSSQYSTILDAESENS